MLTFVGKESSSQLPHWRLCVGMISLGQDWLSGESHVASHRSTKARGAVGGNDQGNSPTEGLSSPKPHRSRDERRSEICRSCSSSACKLDEGFSSPITT